MKKLLKALAAAVVLALIVSAAFAIPAFVVVAAVRLALGL